MLLFFVIHNDKWRVFWFWTLKYICNFGLNRLLINRDSNQQIKLKWSPSSERQFNLDPVPDQPIWHSLMSNSFSWSETVNSTTASQWSPCSSTRKIMETVLLFDRESCLFQRGIEPMVSRNVPSKTFPTFKMNILNCEVSMLQLLFQSV